jgi:hypothetical protein
MANAPTANSPRSAEPARSDLSTDALQRGFCRGKDRGANEIDIHRSAYVANE